MKYKHFNLEDRKTISSCISKKMTCVAIAEELGSDPTSISKELKRNRIECTRTRYPVDEECPILKRFPHICANCDKNTPNVLIINSGMMQKLLKKVQIEN